MRNVIEKLVRNKKVVLPPDLFFSNDAKMLLEELIKKYSIQEIDEVIIDYINYIDEDAKLPTHKDYFPQYQKRIKTPTLNRISKSSTVLGRKQTQELGMDRLNMLIGKGLGKSNPWVEHVKKYAKENNITYMCAITEASKTYKKDNETKIIKVKKKKLEEEDVDIISNELQKLLFASGNEKIKNALIKLNYKGRLHTNPILRNMQLLQNFNSVKKMKELMKELMK